MTASNQSSTYSVVLVPAEEGGYLAYVPAFDNVVTEGETVDEALAMTKELIEGLVLTYQDLGWDLPYNPPAEVHTVKT